jgi:hypothetical protein
MSSNDRIGNGNAPFARVTIRIVSSELGVEDISKRLDLQPTRTGRNHGSSGAVPDERWFLDCDLPDSESIETQLRATLDRMWQSREKFQALRSVADVDIWCTVSTPKEFAGFVLEREIVERAAALGVDFVFSVYAGSEKHQSA